eukprot:scaffold2287_cov69-Alexandrium_tamarense.AAC.1
MVVFMKVVLVLARRSHVEAAQPLLLLQASHAERERSAYCSLGRMVKHRLFSRRQHSISGSMKATKSALEVQDICQSERCHDAITESHLCHHPLGVSCHSNRYTPHISPPTRRIRERCQPDTIYI